MAASPGLETFPPVAIEMTANAPSTPLDQERRLSNTSSLTRRLSRSFMEADMPVGFMAATADMTSSVFVAGRTRSSTTRTRSSVSSDADDRSRSLPQRVPTRGEDTALGVVEEHQRLSRSEDGTVRPTSGSQEAVGADKDMPPDVVAAKAVAASAASERAGCVTDATPDDREYQNGYHFPPHYSKSDSTRHAAVAFWKYVRTPVGFLVVVYGLNVVAWGGMLFLLLCNASPAMCHPTCNDINSPRRVWVEIDSQILNALFCVTGFGLAPWRLRDLFYLLRFRFAKDPAAKEMFLRRLAGIHSGWIRLPGSEKLPVDVGPNNLPSDTPLSALPYPTTKIPDAPLTGERAPPTVLWHIDFVLWMNAGNTFLQCVLSGFMWGMNRHNRPSWSTGLFVALGCMAGAIGGLGMFVEGKRVKSIEGVPLTDEDYAKLAQDREQGIYHYNNIKDKKPKEKADKADDAKAS